MFPDIGKGKKKTGIPVNQQMIKEWSQIRKQLEVRHKNIIGKISWQKFGDYTKICRLKQIPEFYMQYFISFLYKAKEEIIEDVLQKQINFMINSESHHHRITNTLKEREEIRKQTVKSLEIVNGFNQMNSGKNVTPSIKNKINELLKECHTLDQIKEIEKKQTKLLASNIVRIRKKTKNLVEQVNFWRASLRSLSDAASLKRLKIIYPHHGINCLFTGLYDLQFIRTSFLKKEYLIASQENPFVNFGKELKRKGQWYSLFNQIFEVDTEDYLPFEKQIIDEIPRKETDEEVRARERQKLKDLKEIKEKQKRKRIESSKQLKKKSVKKVNEKQKQREKEKRQQNLPSGIKKSLSVVDIESILMKGRRSKKKKNLSNEKRDESLEQKRPKSSNKLLSKSPKSPSKNVSMIYKNKNLKTDKDEKYDKLINEKKYLENQLKAAHKEKKEYEKFINTISKSDKLNKEEKEQLLFEMKKNSIESQNLSFEERAAIVYKNKPKGKNKKKAILQNSELQKSQISEVVNEKKILQKQLKQRERQIKKYQKLLKKVENENIHEKNENEMKMKRFSEEVDVLKLKLDSSRVQNKGTTEKRKHNKSVSQLYNAKSPPRVNPFLNALEDDLNNQKKDKKNLQKQIKQLNKQKVKLEQIIAKSEGKVTKQKEVFEKKIEKYENVINKLKEQSGKKNKKFEDLEVNEKKIKKSGSLNMYTTTPVKDKEKHSSKDKDKYMKSANYFQTPQVNKMKEAKKHQDEVIIEKDEDEQIEKNKSEQKRRRAANNIEIIQTKKTIEIVYERSRRKKNKKEEKKDLSPDHAELEKVKKQKDALLFKLEREENRKQAQKKSLERSRVQKQGAISKYKEMIERQRSKKYEVEQKMKQMRKTMYDQFEERMKKQKMRFHDEKKELLARIENEKEERLLKEKYLSNQVKFLKEMQSNENELLKMLENEKKQKRQKEKELQEEITKKQQLLSILQIQQIKKGIESQVRKQLQNVAESDEEQEKQEIKERKQKLERQIEEMEEQRNQQLQEIDEQNDKLKSLIDRIKDEENRLMNAIKVSMDDDQQQEQQQIDNYYHQLHRNTQERQEEDKQQQDKQQSQQQEDQSQKKDEYDLQEVQKQFRHKLNTQLEQQRKVKEKMKDISDSPNFKKKQQVQDLVQMYLKSPHKYPQKKQLSYSPKDKQNIEEDVLKRSKAANNFERQLLQLRQMQAFVPTDKNDMMTSHLLNLKEVYENEQTSKLKEELFPNIKGKQQEKDSDLSYQSDQTPPPVTIRDHVQLHSKNFPITKKNSKNFLAINKMRVFMLEENRKQKQKQQIQEQSKKNVVKFINRKKSAQKDQKKEQKKEEKKDVEISDIKSTISKKSQVSKKNLSQKNKSDTQKQLSDVESIKKSHVKKDQGKKEQIDRIEEKGSEQGSNYQNQFDTDNMQFTNQHTSLDKEKKQLEKDVREFQDEIRSYISGQERFEMYQQFVNDDEIDGYAKQLIQISTNQTKNLNHNPHLRTDIHKHSSVLILIAKDKNNMEIGIGIFHKEFLQGIYICDYVIAHNMRNFLNLIFNFSRYIFKIDNATNKIQFYFNIHKLQDEISILYFMEFQEKCKRLGEVYVRIDEDRMRKYILRRNLFQHDQNEFQMQGKGIQFQTTLRVHQEHFKQRKYGFDNKKPISYTSHTTMIANYLKRNEERLNIFRKNAEQDLMHRQLLLTALMFAKKQVQLKNVDYHELGIQQKLTLTKELYDKFNIADNAHNMEQNTFSLTHELPSKVKRCTFQLEGQQINYVIHFPEEPITKIQSSNSSQTGIFMGLIPKYKLLLIEAQQFITMNKANPQVNAFFYIKHFIKNIVDVKKETYPRIFIPETCEKDYFFLDDVSEPMKASVFSKDHVKFGWSNPFSNSIVFPPSHKDLIIKKPFIISLLSANVQRYVEGTPLFAKLIT